MNLIIGLLKEILEDIGIGLVGLALIHAQVWIFVKCSRTIRLILWNTDYKHEKIYDVLGVISVIPLFNLMVLLGVHIVKNHYISADGIKEYNDTHKENWRDAL